MGWITLNREEQLAEIVLQSESSEKPIAIFKHSTRCGLSLSAKKVVEESHAFQANGFQIYFLDLITYRNISNSIAETFQVQHESPQLLFIKNGECIYEVAHGTISGRSFEKVMNFV